jgi:hypothetical protein
LPLNNNSITHVCYDGVGARKGGTHTKKQFLDIMNKSSSISWKKKYTKQKQCMETKKKLKNKCNTNNSITVLMLTDQ